MSNSSVKSRATSNPRSGILSPGSLASVPQKDVRLVLGLKRLARSSLLSRGRHCLQYGLPSDVRELNIIPFWCRARYTTTLALSSPVWKLPVTQLHSYPLHSYCARFSKPKLKMVSAVFQPACRSILGLPWGLSVNLLTGNSQSGSLTSLPSLQEQRWHQ